MSLKRAARDCGFADEQKLRLAFRKTVGVVRREWRGSQVISRPVRHLTVLK